MNKVTKEQELEICQLYQNKVTIANLARKFNIGETTIGRILKKHNVWERRSVQIKRRISKELEIEICNIYENDKLTIKQLEVTYSLPRHILTRILKQNNIIILQYKEIFQLKPQEKENIINLYVNQNKTLREISKITKRSPNTIRKFLIAENIQLKSPQDFLRTPLTEKNELELIKDYIDNKMRSDEVQRKYKIRQRRFYSILKKYNQKVRKSNDTRMIIVEDERLQRIIEMYEKSKSFDLVCKYFNIGRDVLERIFTERGITVIKHSQKGVTFYDKWALLYGESKAKEMYDEYLALQSKNNSGENNAMYGKPSPNGSGHGWKGWYKKFYFRSLRELSYVLYLDDNNIRWETAEKKRFRIKYQDYKGTERTYAPDFLVNNNKLVEIKPKRLQNSPLIKLKTEAAIKFCKENDLIFEILDFPINAVRIELALNCGFIKFARDYKERFLNYLKTKTH